MSQRMYVASSWRNAQQPEVVGKLRAHGFEVYDFKQQNPTLKLWVIANQLPGLCEGSKILSTDAPGEISDKKRVLTSSVSRYLKQATKSIEGTGKGTFP